MHFVVIFIAIIWLIFRGLKEGHNSLVISSAYKKAEEEAARRSNIPASYIEQLRKYLYCSMYDIPFCNPDREVGIFSESKKETGYKEYLMSYMEGRPLYEGYCPGMPRVKREEALRQGFDQESYDNEVKLYKHHEKKCNAEGFLTFYQVREYRHLRNRISDEECKKYIIK